SSDNIHMLFATVGKYQLTRSFNVEAQYQFERQSAASYTNRTMESYYTRNLINLFSQVSDNGQITHIVPLGDILRSSYSSLTGHKARGQLNFERNFDTHHHVVAFLGGELSHREAPSSSHTTYGYDGN